MLDDASAPLRRLLLVLLLIGLLGSATELVLLKHYENGWMLVPFAAIALRRAGGGVAARRARRRAASPGCGWRCCRS